mmetsp:Transcript_136843/g.309165  ORF Transcript_136843/g.309165 Transcript_136843/m.309165 type:complete len:165 (-) Transcript_136843:69-563(-)
MSRKVDPARLKSFFARGSVVANLLQARLSVPLAYPVNTRAHEILDHQMRMNNDFDRSKFMPSPDLSEKLNRSLEQATPVILGMSKAVHLLKAANALSNYRGGVKPNVFKPTDQKYKDKLHFPHQQQIHGYRGARRVNNKVGLGRGWDDYGSGIPADSAYWRFKR